MMGVRLDLAAMPDFGPQLRAALEMTRSQFPELQSAPRVIQESLLFPYLEGASFVQALWSRGERVAPLGEYLPQSSEQVLEHDLSDVPVELEVEVSGARTVDDDVLGRLSLGVLLEEHLGDAGEGLDVGWAGDHYALIEHSDGRRGLVWYVLWDDVASRDRFASAIRGALDRFGGPATLQRTDVGGRPATVLEVGALDGVVARARIVDAP
jgi:hypothetical protein